MNSCACAALFLNLKRRLVGCQPGPAVTAARLLTCAPKLTCDGVKGASICFGRGVLRCRGKWQNAHRQVPSLADEVGGFRFQQQLLLRQCEIEAALPPNPELHKLRQRRLASPFP